MEGNFRIVQNWDSEFIIQKEVVKTTEYPWYKFKKNTTVSRWWVVDEKGDLAYSLFTPLCAKDEYKASTLEEAKEQLSKIKKYPIIITE